MEQIISTLLYRVAIVEPITKFLIGTLNFSDAEEAKQFVKKFNDVHNTDIEGVDYDRKEIAMGDRKSTRLNSSH